MDYGSAAEFILDNLPFVVATGLVILFGIMCALRRPVKALCLGLSVIVSVIWGIV